MAALTEHVNGTVSFQAESISSCWDEAVPLMLANANEAGINGEYGFDPARTKFEQMEILGFVRVFTARLAGKLIGYQIFLSMHGLNYPEQLLATCHAVYVAPEHRGRTAIRFLRWADHALMSEGVHSIARQSTVKRDVSRLYARLGYSKIEENWLVERPRGPLAGGPYDGY